MKGQKVSRGNNESLSSQNERQQQRIEWQRNKVAGTIKSEPQSTKDFPHQALIY